MRKALFNDFVFLDGAPGITRMFYDVHYEGSSHCQFFRGEFCETEFVAVYRHPRFPRAKFLELLFNIIKTLCGDFIVFGDCNIDFNKAENQLLLTKFKNLNARLALRLNESTTEYNTLLDVCFTNVNDLTCHVYETYYSYHKGLCINF